MITIDPAVHHYAFSHWEHGALSHVVYVAESPSNADGVLTLQYAIQKWAVPQVVLEIPKVYDAQHQKGDQKDIRDLAMAAGSLRTAARFALGVPGERTLVEEVEPRAWKGTLDKKVMLVRILSKLSELERAILAEVVTNVQVDSALRTGKGPAADVIDSIGLGLWKLERLNRGRRR